MHDKKTLHLESMYLSEPPAGRAHFVRLTLTAVPEHAQLVGTIMWDPNTCSLDLWGDRGACTRMAVMSQSVRATLMRTYDEKKLGRRHYQAEVEGAAGVAFHLIEHRRAHLWYLVIPGKDHGFHVVPLFPSEAFADQSSATIGTVPIPEEH